LLDEVLTRYAGRAFLDIELKVPGLEQETLAMLARHNLQSGFAISSFFPAILRQLRELSAQAPLGFLSDRESSLAHWRELPVEYVIPHFSLLKHDLFSALHTARRKVMVWTVNRAEDMCRFSDWGVDGIISDNPALLVGTVSV
jgi:glycerophosphoryl diester phosphodiesterase